MTRLVLVLALAGCGGDPYLHRIGSQCQNSTECVRDIPYAYCTPHGCLRKCGPQYEGNTPLSGMADPGCPENSLCVKDANEWLCLPKCTGNGLCGGTCSEGVCKWGCGPVCSTSPYHRYP